MGERTNGKINPITFLKIVGVGVGAVALYPILKDESGDEHISAELMKQIKNDFGFLEVSTSFDLENRSLANGDELRCNQPNYGFRSITEKVKIILNELGNYPQFMLTSLNIQNTNLLIGSDLYIESHKTSKNGPVDGVIIYETTAMTQLIALDTDSSNMAHVLHHELAHKLFYITDYSTIISSFESINRSHNLSYQDYKLDSKTLACELGISRSKGSATCYGKSSPEEDFCEIAAGLLTGDPNLWYQAYGEKDVNGNIITKPDSALAEKIKIVVNRYNEISSGILNYRFFYSKAYQNL